MIHRLRCSEVWGGVRNEDVDACSGGVEASLYSSACDGGGRGGDIYCFSVCDGDMLTRIAVADVVGHGAAAAKVSEQLFEAMKERMNDLDGGGMLSELNQRALDEGMRGLTTAAVAAFYKGDSSLYFSYAGHHDALVRRRGADRWMPVRLPTTGGTVSHLPLGIFADMEYPQGRVTLAEGDRVALYTDGVIEAPDAAGELFGLERLLHVLDRHARSPLPEVKGAVLETLRRHTGGDLSHDDVTLLVVEVR